MTKLSLRSSLSVAYFTLALSLCAGCQNNSVSEFEDLHVVSVTSSSDELSRTMAYIHSQTRFEVNEFRNKVNSGLNRWASSLDAESKATAWARPAQLDMLPASLRQASAFRSIDVLEFNYNDAAYIQQTYWLQKLSKNILSRRHIANFPFQLENGLRQLDDSQIDELQSSDDLLVDFIKIAHPNLTSPTLESDPATQLAQALRLFDWTVRNIQLREGAPWPSADEIRQQSLVDDVSGDEWPAVAGVATAGCKRFPWQSLTYSRGDYLDRAKIFALLCWQCDLPATILAFDAPNDASPQPYREWTTAVLIDNEYYLFDTQLGLPIQGPLPGSVATLSQVSNDPQLIRALDLTPLESVEETNYQLDASDIEKIQSNSLVALMVVPPESISKRMNILESKFFGEMRLDLTQNVSDLASKLESHPAVEKAILWHAPFSTAIFRQTVNDAIEKISYDQNIRSKLAWYAAEEQYVDNFVRFRTARHLYLCGEFQSFPDLGKKSCIGQFFAFMYTDDEIDALSGDPKLQRNLGIFEPEGMEFSAWRKSLDTMEIYMKLVRADAAFFMAMAHFENGHPATALQWAERIATNDIADRWKSDSLYQQGRALESTGDFSAAAATYDFDSLQRHGNLLRKRWCLELQKSNPADP